MSDEPFDFRAADPSEIERLSVFLAEQIRQRGAVSGATLGSTAAALGFSPKARLGLTLTEFLTTYVPDVVVVGNAGLDVMWGLRGQDVPSAAQTSNLGLPAEVARAILSPNSSSHVLVVVNRSGTFRTATPSTPSAHFTADEIVIPPVPAEMHRDTALRFAAEVAPPFGAALANVVGKSLWHLRWREMLRNSSALAERYRAARQSMLRAHLRSRLVGFVADAALSAAVEFPMPQPIRSARVIMTPASRTVPQSAAGLAEAPCTPAALSTDDLRAVLLRAVQEMPDSQLRDVHLPMSVGTLAQLVVDVRRARDAAASR